MACIFLFLFNLLPKVSGYPSLTIRVGAFFFFFGLCGTGRFARCSPSFFFFLNSFVSMPAFRFSPVIRYHLPPRDPQVWPLFSGPQYCERTTPPGPFFSRRVSAFLAPAQRPFSINQGSPPSLYKILDPCLYPTTRFFYNFWSLTLSKTNARPQGTPQVQPKLHLFHPNGKLPYKIPAAGFFP